MNTKKKHKNRPKPTPNVAAQVEIEVKEEKVENVIPKSDVKDDIPAVVAATPDAAEVIAPVVENVETDSETPKKPKRKGKKKTQDKETVEENTVDKAKSEVINQGEVPKTEKQVSNEGDDVKEQDENSSTEAYVTPSARKKKNKKKSPEQASQQPIVPEEECLPLAVEEKDIQNIIPEIKDDVLSKTDETKPDTKAKKKNKKKKRNDSEKSDKLEEITCTSAFQQLLIESIQGQTPSEEAEIKAEETQTIEDIVLTNIIGDVALEKLSKSSVITATEKPSLMKTLNQDTPEAPQEESKNKKKNKKDKKHTHVEQQKELTTTALTQSEPELKQLMALIQPVKSQPGREPSLEPISEAIAEIKPDTDSLEPLNTPVKREPSPKPKAKIAKPVEKKRKCQQDAIVLDNLEKSTESTLMREEVLQGRPISSLENVEIKMAEKKETIKVEPTIEAQNVPQTTDTINMPDVTRDKKRKKSPKPSKSKETTEVKEESLHKIKLGKIEQPTKASSDLIKSDEEKPISGSENVTFTMCDEPFIPLQKSEKTEMSPLIDDVPPLFEIEETNIPENKAGKKKNKIPKFPMPSETTVDKNIKQLVTPEVTEIIEVLKTGESSSTSKVAESLAAPLSDIEIQSVKSDESGSSCDVTPDVHFIRASSHQILDNNNNTVIQEVRNVEDTKLNEPFIKPLIEGSGETPSGTPDLVSSGIQMTESKTTGKKEPTYLKSKMMEVNQDMEELRLSIERSLAEFSAIEKTEQKAEKDYESHRIECEKTFAEVQGPKPEAKTIKPEVQMALSVEQETKSNDSQNIAEAPPVCPARKDNKGKSKSKKKGKQETAPSASTTSASPCESTSSDSKDNTKDKQGKQEKTEQKTESTEKKGKQQSGSADNKGKQSDTIEQEKCKTEMPDDSNNLPISEQTFSDSLEQLDFAPIDSFEDAMTSSIDDVNKSFEMIVNNNAEENQRNLAANKPEINITAPVDETESSKKGTNKKDDKVNPVSQPKNFLGHNDIPVQSNRVDYKKEKNKTPNERQAKVKIKDAMNIEAKKQSKESQTDIKRTSKMKDSSEKETFSRVKNDNEEYVYKYSFRKVFLQSACHVCHKELAQRVPCSYCNLVFYCGAKHKDEDWAQHQALCFAVSTIVHLKDQKHIYADAQNITGQEYRLLRMQMIVSCEKVLKRRLVPWEQEAMLYPRMCGDVGCREWRQSKLKDCEGCGQISYCADQPHHLPKSHQRWCKSYHLYSKLVGYQQTRGRLEPRLPTKVMGDGLLAEKMNEVLAAMYEEKIDMNDIQYAALTQLATAPLTAAYCYQMCMSKISRCNGVHKKSSFTIHVVGAELQFEADALNKWEVFFLHLRPDVEELRVVLISPVLNPGDLPLDLLGKIRLCENCRQSKRRVVFSFQDKKNYSEYRSSEDFVSPKLVCAFNPSIQRSSVYSSKDPWPNTINCIIKQKVPFIITGYTITELRKDIARIKECSEIDFRVISEPVFNNFASVRPDRNFISDDEMPLLFKNYCVSVLYGC